MSDLQQQFDEALARLRRAGTDLQTVGVKAAQGGLPKTVCESVAAFTNASGGLLILGLDEAAAFQPVHVDAAKLAADLTSACADQLDPPIRADVGIV
ncbi:MAG: ATP-binding protein [Acidimicrobiales bacterium]